VAGNIAARGCRPADWPAVWLPGGRLPTCRVAVSHAARRADDSQWRTGATRHMSW